MGSGLDLGLMLQPVDGLHVGAILVDATGTQIRWDTPDEPVFTRDRRFRFGMSYRIALPVIGKATFGVDLETDRKDLRTVVPLRGLSVSAGSIGYSTRLLSAWVPRELNSQLVLAYASVSAELLSSRTTLSTHMTSEIRNGFRSLGCFNQVGRAC